MRSAKVTWELGVEFDPETPLSKQDMVRSAVETALALIADVSTVGALHVELADGSRWTVTTPDFRIWRES